MSRFVSVGLELPVCLQPLHFLFISLRCPRKTDSVQSSNGFFRKLPFLLLLPEVNNPCGQFPIFNPSRVNVAVTESVFELLQLLESFLERWRTQFPRESDALKLLPAIIADFTQRHHIALPTDP